MSEVMDQQVETEPEENKTRARPTGRLVDETGQPLDQEATIRTESQKRPLYKRPAFLIGAVIVFLVAAILGVRYWLYARSHESTDDAFIDAHITQVSPKVSGYVIKVYVDSNQQVNKGDLL